MPDAARNESTEGDVVDLLVAQHHQVRELFSSVQSGPDREEAFRSLVRLLAVHETAEEEVVYPALRSTGPEGDRLADARLAEEAEAKTALSELEKLGVNDEDFAVELQRFRTAVLDHAEHEEHEVFPVLRQSLDADTLATMRTALEKAEKFAPTHPHPHAPESGIGNVVAGPFVAIVDRVRDAIRGVRTP